jgi:hypothetical protein
MRKTIDHSQPLPALEMWTKFLAWFINTADKFPKKARFTFTNRMLNLGLDIAESLVAARFTLKDEKAVILQTINLRLEQLRLLSRLCCDNRIMPLAAYEHMAKELTAFGTQIGAWLKEVRQRV